MVKTAFTCLLLVLLVGCSATNGPRPDARTGQMDQTIVDEIDAAAAMTFEEQRAAALIEIASRSYLSADVQVYLVKAVAGSLVFDSSKLQVLLALINNPYFVSEGKAALFNHIDEFEFDSSRQAILKALHHRGTLPSERK